jgi:branched-chain amino acid transport system substrate-binding protein
MLLEAWMRVPTAVALFSLAFAAACTEKKESGPAAASGSSASASQTAGNGAIVFGHVASLSGSEATFGQSTDRGIKLAVEEWNAKGGVKGHKLEVKTLDNQGKPEESAVAATRLVAQDKVNVLLGEVASSRSLAMAPIADRYQVPMITPSSTNPKVTKDGTKTRPYVFRVCFIDPFQGTVMAKFARDNLKISKVGVLRDVGNDYSMGLADYFIAKFKELGGTIVSDESYKAGDQDFKAQLTSIKNRGPEAVYVPGYYTDVALIARQARELGMQVPLMGGDGWDSPKLFEIGGKAIEGCYYSNHYSHEDPEPRIQSFVKKYKEKWGETPDGLAASGYDAANVAIDAMQRASDLGGPAIKDAIASTKDYPGVTGVITIDADHNAVKPAVVLEVKNGTSKYVTTVKP